MSAKGRGHQTEDLEFYPTPREVVHALLQSPLLSLPNGRWIEPCAGTGRIIAAVNEIIDVSWSSCEINRGFAQFLDPIRRPQDASTLYQDFVHAHWPHPRAHVLIMNPPFSFTHDFVKAGFERADWVVCLQRQGWFGTKERASWLQKYCPDCYQLPWRPSFRPDGNTDSCEYCWFVWPPGSSQGRREGKIAMLDRPSGGQMDLL